MKKVLGLFFAFAIAVSVLALPASAEFELESNEAKEQATESYFDSLSEESENIVISQHPNKKYTPVYAAIGILGAGSVVAAAVVISKKMK